jgi:hypothetical protein
LSQPAAVRLLGLLLRDRELRRRFARNRSAVIQEFGVAPDQASYLCALDSGQLDDQAESLIRKRRAAVARLLPRTWRRLGRQAPLQFRQYVEQSPWPEGHRRHFADAAMFCRFLRRSAAAEYLRSEYHWAAFWAGDRPVSVRAVPDVIIRGKERWAVLVCFRRHGVAVRKVFCLRDIRDLICR